MNINNSDITPDLVRSSNEVFDEENANNIDITDATELHENNVPVRRLSAINTFVTEQDRLEIIEHVYSVESPIQVESPILEFSVEIPEPVNIPEIRNNPIVSVDTTIPQTSYNKFIDKFNWFRSYNRYIPRISADLFRLNLVEGCMSDNEAVARSVMIIGLPIGFLIMCIILVLYVVYLFSLYVILSSIDIIIRLIYIIQKIILSIIFHIVNLALHFVIYPLMIIAGVPGIFLYYYTELDAINITFICCILFAIFVYGLYKIGIYNPYKPTHMPIEEITPTRPQFVELISQNIESRQEIIELPDSIINDQVVIANRVN
jgi:hypothetical protein